MRRLVLVTLLAGTPFLATQPASACHPPPAPDLGCPDCLRNLGGPFDGPPFSESALARPPFCPDDPGGR